MEEQEIKKQIYINKKSAYYECVLNSFYENRMEIDRQLLTISCASIGYLTYYIEKIAIYKNNLIICIWSISIICFFVSIMLILFIFYYNSELSKSLIKKDYNSNKDNKEVEQNKNKCHKLDLYLYRVFSSGILSLVLFFIMVFYMQQKDIEMKKNNNNKEKIIRRVCIFNSLDDIEQLEPKNLKKENLEKDTNKIDKNTNSTNSK